VFEERLKVMRPLNEVKNDSVNYHQIVKLYGPQPQKKQTAKKIAA